MKLRAQKIESQARLVAEELMIHGSPRSLSFVFEAGHDLSAALLADKLQAGLAAWNQWIIRESYQLGFTDANRQPKRRHRFSPGRQAQRARRAGGSTTTTMNTTPHWMGGEDEDDKEDYGGCHPA